MTDTDIATGGGRGLAPLRTGTKATQIPKPKVTTRGKLREENRRLNGSIQPLRDRIEIMQKIIAEVKRDNDYLEDRIRLIEGSGD